MKQKIIHGSIAVLGLISWWFCGQALTSRAELDVPLNFMGINRSPYGEVLALAVQGPIDQTFRVGMFGIRTTDAEELSKIRRTGNPMVHFSVHSLLNTIESFSRVKTGNRRISEKHRLYLRGNAEKKLRFAYQLDPSQYSNYNALHFFLTEPSVGTRKTLTPEAERLAHETIEYCLKIDHDPRPALTAAAACTNMLHLMFAAHNQGSRNHTTDDMRQILEQLDQCISRFDQLSNQWHQNGSWENLSSLRVQECTDRLEFILKIRQAAAMTIRKYESESSRGIPNP